MERASQLLLKKFLGRLTESERAELDAWLSEDARRRALSDRLMDYDELDREYRGERLINTERPARDMEALIAKMRRRTIMRRIAAVAAVFVIVLCVTLLLAKLSVGNPGINPGVSEDALTESALERFAPGRVGALVTDGLGRAATLGASDTSVLANSYLAGAHPAAGTAVRNLNLEVGRGKEFRIILEDSTTVWLNSESTLSYPEKFGSRERRVSVTGEVYFEVKHDERRPFIVETGGQSIRVYGTTFNVRGYADEDAVLTTLETGSVAISAIGKETAELYLSPGHQSCFSRADCRVTMKTVDPEIVTGWRHGKFVFEESTLESIMRDLSRWYDFRYEFRDPDLRGVVFMGSVSRYADFNTVISILEDSGEARFSIEDDVIVISHK